MDISLNHREYKVLKPIKGNYVEESVEAELSLPEYMPEILRIIKAVAQPKIISVKLVGERVTVEGTCEMRMIYTAEDGCVYTYTQTRPFTRHCENTMFLNACDVNAQCSIAFVNCKATGTKRAEIKAGIKICINAFIEEKEDIISADICADIEEKKEHLTAVSLGGKRTKSFAMSDTVSLKEPSAFVVSQSAVVILSDVKKISNKLMLRGEAVINICYVNGDNKSITEHISHSIPLNQILEIDSMEENFDVDVVLRVTSLDVIYKGEQGSFITSFDVSLGVEADITMWEQADLAVLCDAYSVNGTLDLKKEHLCFYNKLGFINDTFTCNESFTVPGEGIDRILDCIGEISNIKTAVLKDCLEVYGTLNSSFTVKDSNASLSSISKAFDFKYCFSGDFENKRIISEPYFQIASIKSDVKDINTIELSAELHICATVLEETELEAVTGITESETPTLRNKNTMTVYFPSCENESLWSIARRYSTTVTAIAEENDLKGDTTESLKILFIPSA